MSKTADQYEITELQDYESLVGSDTIERVQNKAEKLHGTHVVHVNSILRGRRRRAALISDTVDEQRRNEDRLEQYLDLFNCFETVCCLKGNNGRGSG